MHGKRALSNKNGSEMKRQRKAITLDVKTDVLAQYEPGECTADIKHALGLSESTLRTICDSSIKIKENVKSGTSVAVKKTSYAQNSIMKKMEQLLSTWIEHQNQENVPISMFVIQAKAKSLYKDLEKEENGKVKPFNASSGWFVNFRKRYNFHNLLSNSSMCLPSTTYSNNEVSSAAVTDEIQISILKEESEDELSCKDEPIDQEDYEPSIKEASQSNCDGKRESQTEASLDGVFTNASGGISWSYEATLLLVEAYKSYRHTFSSPSVKKMEIWRRVAQVLREKGYKYDSESCDKKMRLLKHRYKTICDTSRRSGKGRGWVYFSVMHDLFADDPSIQSSTAEESPIADTVQPSTSAAVATARHLGGTPLSGSGLELSPPSPTELKTQHTPPPQIQPQGCKYRRPSEDHSSRHPMTDIACDQSAKIDKLLEATSHQNILLDSLMSELKQHRQLTREMSSYQQQIIIRIQQDQRGHHRRLLQVQRECQRQLLQVQQEYQRQLLQLQREQRQQQKQYQQQLHQQNLMLMQMLRQQQNESQ